MFTACQVTFEKLNRATSKPFVSVCYTGQPTNWNVSQSLSKQFHKCSCAEYTHQIKFKLQQFSFGLSFIKLEQDHCPQPWKIQVTNCDLAFMKF